MKPVDLPVGLLRSPRCIHAVSLAPTGVNANVVIDDIVNDIVTDSVNGIESIDSEGNKCKIFLHLLGYIGDYPESSEISDVMKHSARAPCTMRNFRYKKLPSGPSYCYTTNSFSMNSSFTRGWFGTKALRHSTLSEKQFKYLGMNSGRIEDILTEPSGQWVLLKIASAFDKLSTSNTRAPLTDENKSAVPPDFDPYSQNIIAPDHCITGISKNLLKVCFNELPLAIRMRLDHYLVVGVSKMGITGLFAIYNKSAKSINSVSMPTHFGLLTIRPLVLAATDLEHYLKCFKILCSFSKLFSLLYWWPISREDTMEDFDYVHNSGRYYDDLVALMDYFILNLQNYHKSAETKASIVDTPNVHRLVELVSNTVPTYGHCVLIAELPFEAFHQFLKANISKNTTAKGHLSAMKCVLVSDWLRRLTTELRRSTFEEEDDTCYTGLVKRLIPCGSFLFNSELENEHMLEFWNTVLKHVRHEIAGVIRTHLVGHYQTIYQLTYNDDKASWAPSSHKLQGTMELRNVAPILQRGNSLLRNITFSASRESSLNEVDAIELVRASRGSGQRTVDSKVKAHHRITRGDVVRVLCRQDAGQNLVVDTMNSNEKTRVQHGSAFFLIVSLVRFSSGDLWALAIRLHTTRKHREYRCHLSDAHVQLFRVTNTTTKCVAFHNCQRSKGCLINYEKKHIVHNMSYDETAYIFVLSGKSGFPCRSA